MSRVADPMCERFLLVSVGNGNAGLLRKMAYYDSAVTTGRRANGAEKKGREHGAPALNGFHVAAGLMPGP